MEKALSFLSRHKDVAFATVEENKPKIRHSCISPWQYNHVIQRS